MTTVTKNYHFDLDSLIVGNNFRIKEFIRNIVKSFTDPTHALCVLNTISRPQKPSTIPMDLIRTGMTNIYMTHRQLTACKFLLVGDRIRAGEHTWKFFDENIFCHDHLPELNPKMTQPTSVKNMFEHSLDKEKYNKATPRKKLKMLL